MNSCQPRQKDALDLSQQKRVRFEGRDELFDQINPLIFDAMPLDYKNCEVNPSENPLYIQHAYLNRGEFPPEYVAEQERFIEDINNRTKSQD